MPGSGGGRSAKPQGPRPPAPPTERTPLVTGGGGGGGDGDEQVPVPPSLGEMGRVSSSHKLWDGWGDYSQEIFVEEATLQRLAKALERERGPHELLGEWRASSICSNDILSSCFYTIGLVTSYSGKMAPLCLLLVGCVLYLFRSIYGECISSYPLNGGSYSLLLNTSSKAVAALGACLSVIAYVATGVVSAVTATNYLATVLPFLDVPLAACALLLAFAVVVVLGLRESANVALAICAAHVATLCLLLALGLLYVLANGLGELPANLAQPFPDINTGGADIAGGLGPALLFGFAGGMLGVSGFETSAQYIESQAPGVFLKTLRNMQLGVCFFNPLLSLLAIATLPLAEIVAYSETVMERVAHTVGDWLQLALGLGGWVDLGRVLRTLVSLDAFCVLSGSVLTAYVGIDGLIYQMALDGCLPSFLLTKNAWRGTTHWIILSYLALATSQVLLMEGDVDALAGVYAFAFLGVMGIFTLGCAMLKTKRADLPREVVAPWWHVVGGLAAVAVAFVANLESKPEYLTYFALYFAGVGLVIFLMFQRVQLLQLLLFFGPRWLAGPLKRYLKSVRSDKAIFFCKRPDLYVLNKALAYVRANEATVAGLVIVHCHDEQDAGFGEAERGRGAEFRRNVELVDQMYPAIKVSFCRVQAAFSPALVDFVSRKLDVPKNLCFLTCPDATFRHRIAQFGGMRVITH